MNTAKINQWFASIFMPVACVLLLTGCAETELVSHFAKKWTGPSKSVGAYKVGKPYKIGGTWYYPKEDFQKVETGIASWYGPDFHGKSTANGETYDQYELTAAHRTLQMPSLVRVTNLENGRSIVVRINDRGPFAHGRVIDVSRRSAELLGFINKGTARVRVQVLEKESRKMAAAAKRGMDTSKLTVADLSRSKDALPAPVQTHQRPLIAVSQPYTQPQQGRVRVASLQNDAEMLPESLRTPTITVEELSMPGKPRATTQPPSWDVPASTATTSRAERENFVRQLDLDSATPEVSGRYNQGNFMPDPVVAQVPVRPTGIFVQAGSFSVFENAQRLTAKLSSIGPVSMDPVMVQGREFYRVRVGPLSSVAEADVVLSQVVRAGGDTAKVIRSQ